MKKYLFAFAVALAIGSTSAKADSFSFNFSGSSDSGSGVFTADPTGTAGEFTIVGISGTTDGSAITSLLAPGSFGGNDNLFFYPATGSTFLDFNGVTYLLANGTDINLFGLLDSYELTKPGTSDVLTSFSVAPATASPAPEPGSLLLLGTGILGGLGMVRRRIVAA